LRDCRRKRAKQNNVSDIRYADVSTGARHIAIGLFHNGSDAADPNK